MRSSRTRALTAVAALIAAAAVWVSVASADQMESVKGEITSLLEERHDITAGARDDFSVADQTQLLQTATSVLGSSRMLTASPASAGGIRLGIILGLSANPDADIKRVSDLGFPTCQLGVHGDFGDAAAEQLRKALDQRTG